MTGSPPPAPWTCRCQAVVWSARPPRDAAEWLPPALAGRRPLGVIGGLVRYLDTPVGPYDEVFAAIGLRRGRGLAGHIPFMAVDSAASVAGGRGNWALPKTLAAFAGDMPSLQAAGDGWRAAIHARPVGPALPLRTAGANLQQWPDGSLRRAT